MANQTPATNVIEKWAASIFQSILATVIYAFIPGGIVIYLEHIRSIWATPVLWGLLTTVMVMMGIFAVKAMKRLPPVSVVPTEDNVESLIKDWLDNFCYTVKRDPTEETYFRYVVTTNSSVKILLGRSREQFTGYIIFRTDIAPTNEEMTVIEELGEHQRQMLYLGLQLEMAHARVGYANLTLPPGPFSIFKRLPINSGLNEHEFVNAIDALEAVKNSVAIVFRMSIQKAAQEQTLPSQLVSYTPMQELPPIS